MIGDFKSPTGDRPLSTPSTDLTASYKMFTESINDHLEEEARKERDKRVFDTGSQRDNDSDKPLVNHLDPYLRLRFGYHMRIGAQKYEKGNWQKGQPTEVALESLHRHLAQYEQDLKDGELSKEDHLSAIIFNTMLIMRNEEVEGVEQDHYFRKLSGTEHIPPVVDFPTPDTGGPIAYYTSTKTS